MNPAARPVALGFIVLFGFFARAATYKAPLLDHHGWRQAETAAIARNFARERFNILYPQIDWRGDRAEGYVETGLEVFAFAVAAVSKVTGFHTEIGRFLSSLLFIASCLLVWRFTQRRHGDEAALVAAFFHAFAFPLLLFMERAFMNEALLICLSLGCLVAAQRYIETRAPTALAALLAASSLVAAIKLPYLIIWAPILGLYLEVDGGRFWRRRELWLMGILNVAVAAAWYAHAHRLAEATGLSFGLTDKLFDAATVFSISFPLRLADRMLRDILEPVGLAAVLVGTWLAVGKRQWCEILGVLSFLAYLVLVAVGNDTHDYYQLALMPVASILAAPGALRISEMIGRRPSSPGRREAALGLVLGLAALCTFVRLASAHSWFEYSPADVVMCDAIQKATRPEDRLVFVGDNNPQMLVCVDRKGWVLAPPESTPSAVREVWRQGGARLAVLSRALQAPDVRRMLEETGPPILANDVFEVYRLP